jgi:hypothetical protein
MTKKYYDPKKIENLINDLLATQDFPIAIEIMEIEIEKEYTTVKHFASLILANRFTTVSDSTQALPRQELYSKVVSCIDELPDKYTIYFRLQNTNYLDLLPRQQTCEDNRFKKDEYILTRPIMNSAEKVVSEEEFRDEDYAEDEDPRIEPHAFADYGDDECDTPKPSLIEPFEPETHYMKTKDTYLIDIVVEDISKLCIYSLKYFRELNDVIDFQSKSKYTKSTR